MAAAAVEAEECPMSPTDKRLRCLEERLAMMEQEKREMKEELWRLRDRMEEEIWARKQVEEKLRQFEEKDEEKEMENERKRSQEKEEENEKLKTEVKEELKEIDT